MLEIKNLYKNYTNHEALKEINLNLRSGEFFSLLGPSGCGKTTLLRILAGFETASSGQIFWKGKSILEVTPQERPFNMVFQRHALFPHMTVADNVSFGLRMRNVPESEILKKIKEILHLVHLEGFENRFPSTLSGGQSQRVALARALINEPEILLLDEPLSALDLQLREHMQTELRRLQKQLGITFVYVTHDQEEALSLSDRVAVMKSGILQQVCEPYQLYTKPQTAFTARFVGSHCAIPGKVENVNSQSVTLRTETGQLWQGVWGDEGAPSVGSSVEAFIRPENWQIEAMIGSGASANPNQIPVKLFHSIFYGAFWELQVETEKSDFLKVHRPREAASDYKVGNQFFISCRPEHLLVFGRETC